jgi:hypothetical protein
MWIICSFFFYLIFVVLQCTRIKKKITVSVSLNQINHFWPTATQDFIKHLTRKLWISKNNQKTFFVHLTNVRQKHWSWIYYPGEAKFDLVGAGHYVLKMKTR